MVIIAAVPASLGVSRADTASSPDCAAPLKSRRQRPRGVMRNASCTKRRPCRTFKEGKTALYQWAERHAWHSRQSIREYPTSHLNKCGSLANPKPQREP